MKRRITLKDIASKAGVTVACVSLALRDSPQVAAATKARIRDLAEKLGYRPDPALAALAAYRSRVQPEHFRSVMACVVDGESHDSVKTTWPSMSARARELGYEAQKFVLSDPVNEWQSLLRVLRSRGIRGVMLAPRKLYDEAFPEADCDAFCFVTIGYSVRLDGIHRVSTNQYLDMLRHVGELKKLGYQRPGLWVPKSADGRVNHQFSAGYLAAFLPNEEPPAPIFQDDAPSQRALRAWVRGHKIDAVIGLPQHLSLLRAAGFSIPEKIGFSTFNWHGGKEVKGMTGMDYRPQHLAAGAVDALHAARLNNDHGLRQDAPLTLYNER
ncbi:MAG: LacI family DNA-binding transcriptional regulator, partial [Spartobacteria bacterium]